MGRDEPRNTFIKRSISSGGHGIINAGWSNKFQPNYIISVIWRTVHLNDQVYLNLWNFRVHKISSLHSNKFRWLWFMEHICMQFKRRSNFSALVYMSKIIMHRVIIIALYIVYCKWYSTWYAFYKQFSWTVLKFWSWKSPIVLNILMNFYRYISTS